MLIANRFKLNNKINAGSFGQIHLATDLRTQQTIAVKMQAISTTTQPQLQYQAKLLAYLNQNINPRKQGIPRIFYYGKYQNKFHVMAMDLLGPSLQQLFQKCSKKFTLKTVVMIGKQIISRLRFLHQKKFIHRDIKPQNFLLGIGKYCAKVFMIDLGLSKKYILKNGEHMPYRDDRSLKGTPRYTSLNSHLGIEQSRRDDLQSVIYMLIYFLKGQLPWQNLKQDNNYDRYQRILEKKLSVTVENLIHGIPEEFGQLVKYTRGLHFVEQPNYDYMLGLLQKALAKSGVKIYGQQDLYCWETEDGDDGNENQLQFLEKQNKINGKDKKAINGKAQIQITNNNKPKQVKNNLPQNFSPFDSGFVNKNNNLNTKAPKQQQYRKDSLQNDSFDFNPFQVRNSVKPVRQTITSNPRKDSLDQHSNDNPFTQESFKNNQRQSYKNGNTFMNTKTQRSQQQGYNEDEFDFNFNPFDREQDRNVGKKAGVVKGNIDMDDPFGDF